MRNNNSRRVPAVDVHPLRPKDRQRKKAQEREITKRPEGFETSIQTFWLRHWLVFIPWLIEMTMTSWISHMNYQSHGPLIDVKIKLFINIHVFC